MVEEGVGLAQGGGGGEGGGGEERPGRGAVKKGRPELAALGGGLGGSVSAEAG